MQNNYRKRNGKYLLTVAVRMSDGTRRLKTFYCHTLEDLRFKEAKAAYEAYHAAGEEQKKRQKGACFFKMNGKLLRKCYFSKNVRTIKNRLKGLAG